MQAVHFKSVPLARINLDDDAFHITTRTDVDDLLVSVQCDGLVTPPRLIEKTSAFSIVSGFRRIAACRKLGWHEIMSQVLKPELSDLDCLRLAIVDNAFQRPLNLIEASHSLQKLSLYVRDSRQLAESASELGLPTNPSIINKIKDLCLLPRPIQSGILAGTISLSMAIELGSLERNSAISISRLFNQLKIGLNKQKEIVTLVKEIARREDLTTPKVLADQTLIEIIDSDDSDRGQKGQKIRSFLRQRRYPRLVQSEKTFEIHRKRLKLGPDIDLIPPKEFEGRTYTLKLSFTNLNHLKVLQTQLNKIIDHPSFKKIIDGKHDK